MSNEAAGADSTSDGQPGTASHPYATGGGGVAFAHRVAAVYLTSILTGNRRTELGELPATSISFQTAPAHAVEASSASSPRRASRSRPHPPTPSMTSWSPQTPGADRSRSRSPAEQSVVLLDGGQPKLAVELAQEGRRLGSTRVPPILQSWLAATEAEALAAAGLADQARRQLERADQVFSPDGAEDLPFLLLTEPHLARWRGHCLAELGDRQAIAALRLAQASEKDSVRAATGLHADLALALLRCGQAEEAEAEAERALAMAQRYGSVRQRRRLRAVLTSAQGQVVEEPHQGP